MQLHWKGERNLLVKGIAGLISKEQLKRSSVPAVLCFVRWIRQAVHGHGQYRSLRSMPIQAYFHRIRGIDFVKAIILKTVSINSKRSLNFMLRVPSFRPRLSPDSYWDSV